jgi:hypothetical protein
MRQLSGTTTTRGFAVAVLSVGGIAGFFAFGGAPSAQTAELTPAQTVDYRFPTNWNSATASAPARPAAANNAPAARSAAATRPAAPAPAPEVARGESERYALASLMFTPTTTYGLASASSTPVVPSTLPERANAYADPSADSAAEARRPTETSGDRTASVKPHDKNTTNVARQPKQSNNVFNDAQIASIKTRLKLTADQQRNWPAVEAALRNITYKKDGSRSGKMTAVDPNSAGVQQLKSAAVPLIMSFNEAQKDEVRQLARLMGLEQVASSF